MRARPAHALLLAPLLACGGGEGGALALAIDSPLDHGSITHQQGQIIVGFHADGIRLGEPGECGDDLLCGHARLRVDGAACDRNAVTPFTAEGGTSPLLADLRACPAVLGEHALTLDLRRDDGTAFEPPLTAQATITVVGAPLDAEPAIAILAPADGATLTSDGALPIDFTVDHYTLKSKGECNGAPACGHVLVHVDGAACDRDFDTPFNAAGATSPIEADLGRCSTTVGGPHAITVELADDDGAPLKPPVAASIAIFVTAGAPQ